MRWLMSALLGFAVALSNANPTLITSHLSHQAQVVGARQTPTNTTAPCAQVSQYLYFPNGTSDNTKSAVPAEMAYNCLNSVPLNATSGKLLLKALVPYLSWQSTLNELKNPPAEYAQKVQPPIDIIGGLAKIASDIDAGLFTSEYDFGWDLYTLIQSAHDGHFTYIPDSVGTVFQWTCSVPLVSVSEDGKKLPSVFAYQDVLGAQFKNISYTPSAVTEINEIDVNTYLQGVSQYGSLQDRDALYNNLFYSLAQVSLGSLGTATGVFSGGGRGRYLYRGPTTTFKFANGSSTTVTNMARPLVSFRGVTSGEILAQRYFFYDGTLSAPKLAEAAQTSEANDNPAAAAVGPGYPIPQVAGPNINGFYINTTGYEDVAILQVPQFVDESSTEVSFQATTQKFLAKAVADGKKKLIIDVQANGGGTILQGYDMFKQLFPSIEPYGANRYHGTTAANLIGLSFSAYSGQFDRTLSLNSTVRGIVASYFNYRTDMDVDGKPFTSWSDKFGPVQTLGDNYTQISRWNLSDTLISYNSGGINITGYGPLSNVSRTSPFASENIVLLTDGYCASTCTIFSEFLTKQAGIKTIAMGGRSNANRIQAIGGVKGVNNYQFGYIQALASEAVRYAPPELNAQVNSSVLQDYFGTLVSNRQATSGGANVRDGLRQNDTSGVPLQFIYENADCRLYYTPEMTVDATAMWKAAADAQWSNSGKCVGNGGYSKRATDITSSLKVNTQSFSTVDKAAMLKKYEALKATLGLQTNCKLTADGFMQP